MQTRFAGAISLLGLGAMMLTGSASAQDSSGDVRCLPLMRIQNTTVIDDSTILFETVNRTYYKNDLPQRCPDLKRNGKFMYRVALDQLCSLDIITVLQDVGFGFQAGAACGLGSFKSISTEQADALIASLKGEKQDAK